MNNQYEFPRYEPGIPCHTVGFHIGLHDEEAAGAAYMIHYGDHYHPGIAKAIQEGNFIFADAGALSYKGKDWQQCHAEGIVFIGTMGSPYDEHYLPKDVRGKECSATLIARALNIQNETHIKPVLNALLQSDRQSEGNLLSFSSHIMRGHKHYGTETIESLTAMATWCIQPFQWLIISQEKMINETKNELQTCCTYEEIQYLGKTIKIALIQSDNDQIVALAKTKAGGVAAHVVICKNSKGHYFISTSKFPFIDLTTVVAELIMEELDARDIKYDLRDKRILSGGPYPGIPWHFQKEENLHRIFNGSLSAPDVEPSKIKMGRVFGTVYRVLKNTQYTEAVVRKIA